MYGDRNRIRSDCLECRPCNTCRRCSHTGTRYRYPEYSGGYGCIDAPSRRRDVTDEKLLLWLDVGDRGTDGRHGGCACRIIHGSGSPVCTQSCGRRDDFCGREEVIPSTQKHGHSDIAAMSLMIGFTLMMILDVALG